jgi:hypothetical protein
MARARSSRARVPARLRSARPRAANGRFLKRSIAKQLVTKIERGTIRPPAPARRPPARRPVSRPAPAAKPRVKEWIATARAPKYKKRSTFVVTATTREEAIELVQDELSEGWREKLEWNEPVLRLVTNDSRKPEGTIEDR